MGDNQVFPLILKRSSKPGLVGDEPEDSARQTLLRMISRSADFLAQLPDLLNHLQKHDSERLKLRLHLPPELADGLQRGDLYFPEARDGSGFLPIAVSVENEKFAKQVRLVPEDISAVERSQLKTAAAEAITHALLREALAKLEVLDRKLDQVLTNQRAEWIGQIIAGRDELERALAEPGHGHAFTVSLGNAAQSVREGMNKGIQQLEPKIKKVPKQMGFLSRVLRLPTQWKRPSVDLALQLDGIQEDVSWLFVAARTLGRIEHHLGRPQAALREVDNLRETLQGLTQPCIQAFRRASYEQSRDTFWETEMPRLLDIQRDGRRELIVEATLDDIMIAVEESASEPATERGGM